MYKRIIAGALSVLMSASAISTASVEQVLLVSAEEISRSTQAADLPVLSVTQTPDPVDTTEDDDAPVILSVTDNDEIYESVSLGDNIQADIYGNGLMRIYGYGDMKDFTEAPFVNAAAVTQVLFEDADPENGLVITSIGNNLFNGMGLLSSAAYGDITKTRAGVFVLPDNLKTIGSNAFRNCRSLKKLVVPQSVTNMGGTMLNGCTGLEELTIPYAGTRKEVTNAGGELNWNDSVADLFMNSWGSWENTQFDFSDYAIEKITVTGGETVPEYAFASMKSLKEVDLSSTSVTSVGTSAFYNCTSLADIKLPETVTDYGSYSFFATPITSMPTNGKITAIGEYAFADCTQLGEFGIPDTCTSIGQYAFRNCRSLKKLVVPQLVTNMGGMMLNGCTGLEELTIPYAGTRKEVTNAGGELNWDDSVADLFMSSWSNWENNGFDFSDYALEKITVTGGERIPEYAFSCMTSVREIEIYDCVKGIDSYAFKNCRSLIKTVIPASVETVASNAFEASDTDVYFCGKDCTIADNAFSKGYSGTIYGYAGSTAEAAAEAGGYKFVPVKNEIVIGSKNITLSAGDKYSIKSDHTGLVFSSSDPTVASVDKNGVISALKQGTAVIEVIAGISGICKMNINVYTTTTTATTTTTTASTTTTTASVSSTDTTSSVSTTKKPATASTATSATTVSTATTSRYVSETTKTTSSASTSSSSAKPVTTTSTTEIEPGSGADVTETTASSTTAVSSTTRPTMTKITTTSTETTAFSTQTSILSFTTTAAPSTTEPIPQKPRRLDIDGKITVTEMTAAQIAAAGIDLTDDSNYHVFDYEVKARFEAEVIKIHKTVKQPQTTTVPASTQTTAAHSTKSTVTTTVTTAPADFVWVEIGEITLPVAGYYETATEEMYMIVHGQCKWLKEFYDVELIVINKDTEPLTDCSAELNVPGGLTLANSEQIQTLGDLGAGQAFDVHWYIRG